MQGRDGGLQRVRPEAARRQCALDERDAFLYLLPVPFRAVLFLERDQLAPPAAVVRVARSGVVQQHQCEQPRRLCFRQQLDDQPAQPNRLGREIGAGEVALVEDEIDDVEDAGESLGKLAARGDSYGILAPLIFDFARTMRWARVVRW